MENAYNLGLERDDIRGATRALLVVDREQVPLMADRLDRSEGEIATHLSFRTHLGEIEGEPVLVMSSGIGGPAVSIAVHELSMLGVNVVIGCGTCGAIQSDIKEGDLIIASGAVRLDGSSRDYAPIEYPAVSNFRVASAVVEAASKMEKSFHIGICASTDTFYPGQERYGDDGRHVITELRGSLLEWRGLGVLGYDMETSTLFVVARALGMRAASMRSVIVNRSRGQSVQRDCIKDIRCDAADVAVEAMRIFIQKWKTDKIEEEG